MIMSSDKFNSTLRRHLEDGNVNHVISVLRRNCESALERHPDAASLLSRLDSVADVYSRMARFMLEGTPDPDRAAVYSRVKADLEAIGRDYLFISNEDRLDPLFTEYRLFKVRPQSVSSIAEEIARTDFHLSMAAETQADPLPFLRKREALVDSLFRRVWSLPPWASDDFDALDALLAGDLAFDVKAQAVSALLLSLLKLYDPRKFLLLLRAVDGADERLAARLLTAVVLVLARWGDDAAASPQVGDALSALADSLLTFTRLRDVVMTLIRTRDTDRVNREVVEAFEEAARNPEWQKLMENKEFEKKMQNLNDMQFEGMDVMMQSFSRLKGFPFFRSVSSWFLPFSPVHTEVSGVFDKFDREAFMLMAEATEMCASDCYSFALGLTQMPETQRNMLAGHVQGQMEAVKEMMRDRDNARRRSLFATEALLFARDLYRFAKLFPKRKDFADPFEEAIDFLSLPVLGDVIDDEEVIRGMADFYFEYGYYPLALPLYERLAAGGDAERQVYEKIGYCCQMAGEFAGALQNYERADLFSSDADRSSVWLLKKLAYAHKRLGHFDKAAEYYRGLLERNPDDLNMEYHLGSLLLGAGDMKRGSELIYKVHYLDPGHAKAARVYSRLKGHEAFLAGRLSEAKSLYASARGDQSPSDYRRDLGAELLRLSPTADITSLRILLDF